MLLMASLIRIWLAKMSSLRFAPFTIAFAACFGGAARPGYQSAEMRRLRARSMLPATADALLDYFREYLPRLDVAINRARRWLIVMAIDALRLRRAASHSTIRHGFGYDERRDSRYGPMRRGGADCLRCRRAIR